MAPIISEPKNIDDSLSHNIDVIILHVGEPCFFHIFTLNRYFFEPTASVHTVSVLIFHPTEICNLYFCIRRQLHQYGCRPPQFPLADDDNYFTEACRGSLPNSAAICYYKRQDYLLYCVPKTR